MADSCKKAQKLQSADTGFAAFFIFAKMGLLACRESIANRRDHGGVWYHSANVTAFLAGRYFRQNPISKLIESKRMFCSLFPRSASGLVFGVTVLASFLIASNVTQAQTDGAVKTVAVIETDQGEMLIEFWDDVAPKTVENFKKLAAENFYDGTAFHRIMEGFMIQGGDPLTKDEAQKAKWGTGGPGYNIDAEFSDRSHVRGVISMARSDNPNSAGSQFFICLGDAKFLDTKYTAFGKLVVGDEILEALGKTKVVPGASGESSSPVARVNVKSIRIEERNIPSGDN